MKWLNFCGLFLGLCASFLVATESHAQLGKLLGGGKDDGGGGLGGLLGGGKDDGGGGLGGLLGGGKDDGGGGLGGLLDSGGSGGGLSNPMGLVGDVLESAENTNLGPVGRYVLGRELAARMIGINDVVEDGDPRLDYLRILTANLLRSSRVTASFKDPVVILFDAPDKINAFAAPGGFVFITTGLMNFLENEDELAFVLAHEIAHIEMDHGLNAIRQNEGSKLFQSATGDMGLDGLFGDLLSWGENGYSKDLEQEADLRGGEIVASLGYNWQSGVNVIKRLEEMTGHTHASGYPADRAAKLKVGAGGSPVSEALFLKRKQRFDEVMTK
jgi:hypothetical protein